MMHLLAGEESPEIGDFHLVVGFGLGLLRSSSFAWDRRADFWRARPSPRATTMGPTLGPISAAKIQHRDPGTLLGRKSKEHWIVTLDRRGLWSTWIRKIFLDDLSPDVEYRVQYEDRHVWEFMSENDSKEAMRLAATPERKGRIFSKTNAAGQASTISGGHKGLTASSKTQQV